MARLEDVIQGLRGEDIPPELREALRPLFTSLDALATSLANASRGNLTLADNVNVERIDCQLSHGVAQTVALKKLSRAGCVIGYSAGEDTSGTAHAFLFPPSVKPTSTPGNVSVLAHFRTNTATRVACSIFVAPDGTVSSKSPSATTDPILTGAAAGGDLGGTYPNPTVLNVAHVTTGVLTEANGGTNQSTYAQGDLLYAIAANTLAKLAKGTSGQLLQQGASVPAWAGDTAWTNVSGGVGFQNSWVDFGAGYNSCGFFKDASGFVHLRGQAKSGTLNSVLFTLPAGYRPAATVAYAVNSNGAFGGIFINNDGTVHQFAGVNTGINIDGITFDTR